jgi:hypothetical protein
VSTLAPSLGRLARGVGTLDCFSNPYGNPIAKRGPVS